MSSVDSYAVQVLSANEQSLYSLPRYGMDIRLIRKFTNQIHWDAL